MTTWFVTRHAGAREWAAGEGIAVDRVVDHLEPALLKAGDVVLGTLPVHLAAEVCARGGRYLHLLIDVPADLRGEEFTAAAMSRLGARLAEYSVRRVDVD